LTIKEGVVAEIRVKKSVFIGSIAPVKNRNEAETYIVECKKVYYDATHNCFAYRIDGNSYRFSDDGEPTNTAGRPILKVLQKNKLLQVVCVVTRYFGGTKLGTGGLMRAYSLSTETVVGRANILEAINYISMCIKYPFNQINKIQNLVQKYKVQIQVESLGYGMLASLRIRSSQKEQFWEELMNVTSGKVEII
jgi:uncharacterized YigZ family protein